MWGKYLCICYLLWLISSLLLNIEGNNPHIHNKSEILVELQETLSLLTSTCKHYNVTAEAFLTVFFTEMETLNLSSGLLPLHRFRINASVFLNIL